ncbi:MAG: type II toxin-antitoxin system VapC family toxin [Acidobacteria bacterium]|nr:type II toxin-antitoxin system VapC family toxin [Acidobacteriota bacterium]MYA46733.1 type II toxin-antitoxin system VapC family toxin [Acidobacteriota bacterium]MYB32254.1 type II toxin-antitoxin system VapC family toxin [Acidobacteriota bacterium]MYH23477.1 type II toxin-antitoxin system VapC family toxin [Acidobacteriota bacterium]MYI38586.1 type II toxin-antitoxin system VapC family toxin [Acidobacteriota bacterium]
MRPAGDSPEPDGAGGGRRLRGAQGPAERSGAAADAGGAGADPGLSAEPSPGGGGGRTSANPRGAEAGLALEDVIIHLDTSALVGALAGRRLALPRLHELVREGHRLKLSAPVLYEWLRGPRTVGELQDQETLLPRRAAVPFDTEAAARAADLYVELSRVGSREMDLAIAACALVEDAALWTLNTEDFRDIPGLKLA